MKTIKDYTSFVNENINESIVDVELDQDVIDYYLEIAENGALSREEAINQVANDFGISGEAVAIIIDEAGIKESVEVEEEEESVEEEEESVEESVEEIEEEDELIEESKDDEKKYLTPKQRKLPEGLKKGIIAKAKKSKGDKSKDEKKDKDEKESKDEKKDKDEKESKSGSDEDKYLSAKQKKLPEGLKKAIIAKAKKKK